MVGIYTGTTLCSTIWHYLSTFKTHLPFEPVILLVWIYLTMHITACIPKEVYTSFQQNYNRKKAEKQPN